MNLRWSYAWRTLSVLAASFLLLLLLPAAGAFAAPVSVTVSGQAAGGDKGAAAEDARKGAMKKALIRLMQPQADPASLYQRLLARYADYTQTETIVQSKRDGGRMVVLAKVLVDVDKIAAAVSNAGAAAQETKNESQGDFSAYFFIRVRGLDFGRAERGEQEARQVYNDTFQAMGFAPGDEDALFSTIGNYRALDCDAYTNAVLQAIHHDYPEITVALIGEIVVSGEPSSPVRSGSVRVQAIDVVKNAIISTYEDSYQVSRPTSNDAEKLILQKAAVNSARALADQTRRYIEGH